MFLEYSLKIIATDSSKFRVGFSVFCTRSGILITTPSDCFPYEINKFFRLFHRTGDWRIEQLELHTGGNFQDVIPKAANTAIFSAKATNCLVVSFDKNKATISPKIQHNTQRFSLRTHRQMRFIKYLNLKLYII